MNAQFNKLFRRAKKGEAVRGSDQAVQAEPAESIEYTDEPWQEEALERAVRAGFKYDKQGGWDASLSTSELLALLKPPAPAAAVPQGPVATLHDDGCFTWKSDEFRLKYDRQRAGWRMDVYAAPLVEPVKEVT